jgi:hypothetical protein
VPRLTPLLDLADVAEADEEGDDADDAEATVDKAPPGRDSAERAGDQGEGQNAEAGDYAEYQYPLVANGIAERAEECDRDDDVGECQPVGAVGHEGVIAVGVYDAVMHATQPGMESGFATDRCRGNAEDVIEDCSFALQREGGEPAEQQANDKKGKPDADPAQERLHRGLPGTSCNYRHHTVAWVYGQGYPPSPFGSKDSVNRLLASAIFPSYSYCKTYKPKASLQRT